MDGHGIPSEISNIFRTSSERISNILSETFSVQYSKCFDSNKTNIEGFESCANEIKKNAESISNRMETFSLFAQMRMSECLQASKEQKECISVAQNLMADIERKLL